MPRLRPPIVRVPLAALDLRALRALGRARFPPATASKRFIRDAQGMTAMTERERAFLWRIAWRFRRQIPDDVVEAAARLLPWATSFVMPASPSVRDAFVGPVDTGMLRDSITLPFDR